MGAKPANQVVLKFMRRLTENFNRHTTRTSPVPASMVIVLVLRSSNTHVVDGQAGFGSIHNLEL